MCLSVSLKIQSWKVGMTVAATDCQVTKKETTVDEWFFTYPVRFSALQASCHYTYTLGQPWVPAIPVTLPIPPCSLFAFLWAWDWDIPSFFLSVLDCWFCSSNFLPFLDFSLDYFSRIEASCKLQFSEMPLATYYEDSELSAMGALRLKGLQSLSLLRGGSRWRNFSFWAIFILPHCLRLRHLCA